MSKTIELNERLVIRAEGDLINAYAALSSSLLDAVLLGSLNIQLAAEERIFPEWKRLMMKIMSIYIEDITGQIPTFSERPAPESERGGNA